MKKVLISLIICLLFVTGCFANSGKPSKAVSLTFNKYEEKINKKESFILLIWRTGCSHCEEFEPKLDEIIKEYNLKIYSINISDLDDTEHAKLANKTFMTGTPTLVVFEKGKYQDRLVGDKDKKEVINFLKENNYIR